MPILCCCLWLLSLGLLSAVEPYQLRQDLAHADAARVRQALASTLQLGAPAAELLPDLRRLTDHPDRDIRLQALRGLGQMRDDEASGRYVAILTDPDPELRAAAREALVGLTGRDQGLPERWQDWHQRWTREREGLAALVDGLGQARPDEAMLTLHRILQHHREHPGLVVEGLQVLMQDGDPELARAAHAALGSISSVHADWAGSQARDAELEAVLAQELALATRSRAGSRPVASPDLPPATGGLATGLLFLAALGVVVIVLLSVGPKLRGRRPSRLRTAMGSETRRWVRRLKPGQEVESVGEQTRRYIANMKRITFSDEK